MKLRRLLESFSVAATGLALVAHGGGSTPICALHRAESVDFDVVGTCGPAGRVNVSMKDGSCGLDIEGDDVGVPTHGDKNSGVRSGGWHMAGDVPLHGGKQLSCSAYHVALPEQTRLEMECHADGRKFCTSYFIDVAEKCDVEACVVPECGEGFIIDLAPDECCPRCIECTSCVSTEPPPEPVCVPSHCPASCEDGYELTDTGDDCCLECTPVIDLEACEAGRAEHARDFAARRDEFLPRSSDAECTVVQASDACAMYCDLLVGGASFGRPFAELSQSAAELCLHCPAPDFTCFGGPPPTAQCVEGTCVLADP